MKAPYILLLFFYFCGLGANLSSLSPYILSNFGNKGEIIFLCIQFAVPLGNFFGGWISDKTKKIRLFLLIGLILSAPTQFLLFNFSNDWAITAFFGGLHRFLLSSNYQWIAIAALEAQGSTHFSRFRSAGTLGFLIIQIVLFVLTSSFFGAFMKSPEETGKLGAVFYWLSIIPAFYFPKKRESGEVFKIKDAFKIIFQKHMLFFFLLSFFYYAAYQVTDNYVGRFFQISHGLDSVFLGWLFAVLIEIPFLLYLPKIIEKYGKFSPFYLALVAGGLRFILFSYASFGAKLDVLLLYQIPHAILFAGFYMGAIYWFRNNTPDHLYGSVYGIYTVVAQSLGGMAGNISTGFILHSNYGKEISIYFNLPESNTNSLNFFPIFIMAAFMFLILIPCFWKLERTLK